MAITLGKPAPAFTLPNQDNRPVSLHDFKGQWVVVYFYPKDNTPGCTVEACQFSESLPRFTGINGVVLGISPDPPSLHQKFIQNQNLTITLLSDPDHVVMEEYDAWGTKVLYGKESLGVIRSTVLVDPEGNVAHHWRKVKADGHADAVLAKLNELSA